MILIRVRYGKKSTPLEMREYQIDGFGPVGCLKEFKEHFPDEELEVFERCCDLNVQMGHKCPICKEIIK